MSQNKSADKTGHDPDKVANKLIEAGAQTQTEAIRRAPQQHVAALQICAIGGTVGVLGGGLLVYKDQPAMGGLVLVVAMIVLVVAIVFLRPERSLGQDLAKAESVIGAKPLAAWSRVTVKLPVPPGPLGELSDALQSIRTMAQAKYLAILQARQPAILNVDVSNLRVNVFLPDSQSAIQGEVCGMHIPTRLHHGMQDDNERRIQFRPNEGLTGRVFTLEKAFGALRQAADAAWQLVLLEGPGGLGDDKFKLTLEQVNLINPALRWIVCFPLKASVNATLQTFGVLNVDGLDEPLTVEEMQALFNQISVDVKSFAANAWRLEKNRISISVEEFPPTA